MCFNGYFKQAIPLALGFTVAFTAMLAMIYPWAKISPKSYEGVQAILGGIVFASTLVGAVNLFMVYYYRKNIPDGLKKHLFRIMIGCFFALAISLFVTLNGYADYLTYPLVNAISLKTFFSRPGEEGFIAFYAIFILTGAIIVYLLCDHKMYMEYGEHGILESTFLVAFPSGIIGARLFYVIGNWNGDTTAEFVPFSIRVANGEWWSIFAVWEGGLTILGGAILLINAPQDLEFSARARYQARTCLVLEAISKTTFLLKYIPSINITSCTSSTICDRGQIVQNFLTFR